MRKNRPRIADGLQKGQDGQQNDSGFSGVSTGSASGLDRCAPRSSDSCALRQA